MSDQSKPQTVLVQAEDHSYRLVTIRKIKVTWNSHDRTYYEYAGDEYLGEGDEVREMDVAE
jgi:hypothetical protein